MTKPSSRLVRVCGNEDCAISSGWVADELTFGRGELDNYGYWEVPCIECASAWKKAYPLDKVWPVES